MIQKAKAVWQGTGRAGSGHLSGESGVLSETPYSSGAAPRTKGTKPRNCSLPHTPPWRSFGSRRNGGAFL
jgi:hypothetical protein